MPPQNLERADEICISGSPLTPRRVNEIRADSGGLGRCKLKILCRQVPKNRWLDKEAMYGT